MRQIRRRLKPAPQLRRLLGRCRLIGLLLIAAGLPGGISADAAEYFIAPQGRDDAAGSREAPFATVQRAEAAAAPGDTVWIRGGTYVLTEAQIARHDRVYACVTTLEKSGESGNPIRYWAWPGERAVFDFSAVKPVGKRVNAFRLAGSWLHLRGFEVIGVQVTIKGHTQSICFDLQGSHIVCEQLSAHDGKAIGFWIGNGSHNLVLNCDAYRNHDDVSEDGRGGNVDGFGFHGPKGSVNNVFRGCRAWFNSDDGFDFISSGEVAVAENCWAFYNGYSPSFQSLGDGNGFKAGGYGARRPEQIPHPVPRHVVRRSIAVRNKANGFYANHHVGGVVFLQNSAYRNRTNFNLLGRAADNRTDRPGEGHLLRNNLGFLGGREVAEMNAAACDSSHNSFDLNLTLTAGDFLSLDEAQLMAPRQPNGDLPALTFLRPKPDSSLVGRGADTGLPFRGSAPYLGALD